MHQCSFCKDPVPGFQKPIKTHIELGKMADGHIHVHGDLQNKEDISELIECLSVEAGLGSKVVAPTKELPKELVFHNRQRIGDILMFTCAIRDLKAAYPEVKVNVQSTAAHIWDHNPFIDRTIQVDKEKVIKIGPGKLTNASNRLDWHFANAYRISIEDALGIHIPQGESRPDIYLTEEEYNAPRLFEKPYWIICITGEKSWGCKMYPFDKWQRVIDLNPDLTFVQIGAKEDNPPRLQGKNVIDYVGMTQNRDTGIRDLFKLFLNAEGSIGLVSFHMHLSGALYKPAVVVAGGREPVSFTRFAYHQYLATDGTMECSIPACWKCDIDKCKDLVVRDDHKIPKCVDIIAPEEISEAIAKYYKGGLLRKDSPCAKPRQFKNIVKTPKIEKKEEPKQDYTPIDDKDAEFLRQVIGQNNVQSVLEFGCGKSTLVMSELATVRSYETEDQWIEQVSRMSNEDKKNRVFGICKWNGRDLDLGIEQFDMAFVDGPTNGQNREEATRIAANHAKIVVIHDNYRDYEKEWENKYLKDGFIGPVKGGRYCDLWIKSPSFKAHLPKPTPVNPNKKKIRIITTARGWGGCARSVTTIMKLLIAQGHEVEFVPFRNKVTSKEFIDVLKNGLMDVKVKTTYDAIKDPCDTLLCYADDFVWEFPRPEIIDAFSNLKADKKVMMVNYRRGKIGELEWTKGWDRYLFLNRTQEKDLLSVLPGVSTGVLPPCTDLSKFFEAKPDYGGNVRIVRHNSQGDTKFDKTFTFEEIINALEARKDLVIRMMPGPSFVEQIDKRFIKHSRNSPSIPKFLEMGNMFWYSLPIGYMDMGPRVILEAMAAGLPILADPWGGALDRVTDETGWLTSKVGMIEIISNVSFQELKAKGEAARERAYKEFRAERWIEELVC